MAASAKAYTTIRIRRSAKPKIAQVRKPYRRLTTIDAIEALLAGWAMLSQEQQQRAVGLGTRPDPQEGGAA